MSTPLLIIIGLMYLGVAASEWKRGDPGMGLAFASYALANVGFIWSIYK